MYTALPRHKHQLINYQRKMLAESQIGLGYVPCTSALSIKCCSTYKKKERITIHVVQNDFIKQQTSGSGYVFLNKIPDLSLLSIDLPRHIICESFYSVWFCLFDNFLWGIL